MPRKTWQKIFDIAFGLYGIVLLTIFAHLLTESFEPYPYPVDIPRWIGVVVAGGPVILLPGIIYLAVSLAKDKWNHYPPFIEILAAAFITITPPGIILMVYLSNH